MLIECPECRLPVSTKAMACPHCGYPIVHTARRQPQRTKRKRLPNGFGQITELKSNLRKPFRAMITTGLSQDGKYKQKIIGFYETYNDAYAALVDYHRNPYDLDTDRMTVEECYKKWFEKYKLSLKSVSSERTITSAWAKCSAVYDLKVSELRARHIKGVIDSVESPNIKSRIKSVFNLMLDYAVEYELVDRNYARTFNLSADTVKDIEEGKQAHMSFTDEEMKKLWANITIPYVDVLLIQCYMGWRPQELGLIELKNVNINEGWIIGGMKTDAGTDRFVPIHPSILPLVKAKYNEAVELGSEYLINCTDGQTHLSNTRMTYDKYRHRFESIVSALDLSGYHRAHDGRKQFVTMAKESGMDEYAIKRIAGHKISDITEAVYTDRSNDWLIEEMKKIKGPV